LLSPRKNNQTMNQPKFPRVAAALAAAVCSPALFAQQVIVFDTFDYADQAALEQNWTMGTTPSPSPLTLNTTEGNPSPSVNNPGTSTAVNRWTGSTFSLTPTDENPIRLTADIFSDGAAGTVTTVGLRTGANPLYEMGLYRIFDNVRTSDNTSEALSPTGTGFGTRTIALGQDLPGQDWVKFGDYYTGAARFEATFTTFGVTTRVDLGIDGSWDVSFTEIGTTPTGAFTDLRIHAPATTGAGTSGAIVDNVRLEVVPEPSTFALFGLGGLAFALLRRRKG
jgi:hypothetical protein